VDDDDRISRSLALLLDAAVDDQAAGISFSAR
jgi:hypothetical protein